MLGSDDGITLGYAAGEVLGSTLGAANGITLGIDEELINGLAVLTPNYFQSYLILVPLIICYSVLLLATLTG